MIATSFFHVLIGVTVLVAWFVAIIGLAVYAMDQGRWDAGIAAIVITIVGFAFIMWNISKSDASSRRECEIHGGSWVQTGSTPILVGKVIVNIPIYGCVTP